MNKKYCFNLAIIFLAVIFLAGCSEKEEKSEKQKPSPLVKTATAEISTISQILELNGNVEPGLIALIASPAEGPIQNLRVREGDRVKTGDIALEIGRQQAAEAELVAAQKDLDKEAEEFNRVKKLVKSGAIPAESMEIQIALLEQKRAQLIKAQEKQTDYLLRVPWNGIVSKVFVRDGDYVAPRSKLVEIYDPASLIIKFAVSEQYAVNVENGTPLKVKMDAYSDKFFEAVVTRVYPELDRQLRTRTIEANIQKNIKLLPGMFARIELPVRTVEDAVVIPDSAVLTTPVGDHVAFVTANGKAVRRTILTGIEQGRRIQVVKGINAGELVVIEGHENLKDGSSVRIEKRETPSASEAEKEIINK